MKVLLLKPIDNIYYVIQPNLGLGYIARIMRENGQEVHILDSGKERLTWEKFKDKIENEEYDLVGIKIFSHEVQSAKKHIGIIKKYSPKTTIIVGGPHISGDTEAAMNSMDDADFGFTGESEIGIQQFINLRKEDYENNAVLSKIPGLAWRQGGRVCVNPRGYHENLDEIKFPAWDLIAPSSYPVAPHKTFCKKTPVAPMIISRGCPFQCTFCAVKSVTGRNIRYRSIKNVIEEILLLYNEYGVREIHIEDDNLTLKREYIINFCKEIIKLNLDLVFALPNGIRLDTLDEEVVKLMEKAGFYSVSCGIESGNNRVLKLMKKSASKELIREKIELIKKHTNIEVDGNFLIGYPGETESEILDTIKFAKSLKIDKAGFMFVIPLPGSELWEEYKQKNEGEVEFENFFSYNCVKSLSSIPPERLVKLYKKATLEFYIRPRIIFGLLKRIKSPSQVKIIASRLKGIFLSGGA